MGFKVGDIEIEVITDAVYRVDGGAAFGIVPRAKWSQLAPPDEEGRVPMAVNCFLIRTRRHLFLVDAGIGNKLNPTLKQTYAITSDGALTGRLSELGVRPEEISGVILTHLHFDHAGGLTRYEDDGHLRVTFPGAAHYIQRTDWEEAIRPNERTRAGFHPEDLLPVKEQGLVRFLEGDHYINPHIQVLVTGGHTTAHQVVRVASRGQIAYFPADIIPAVPFISPVYATAYDVYPLTTLEAKKTLLRRAARRRAAVFLSHQTINAAGRVEVDAAGRYTFIPIRESDEVSLSNRNAGEPYDPGIQRT